MPGARTLHRATLTRREALLFEAGVKLGGLFHQYFGMPVAPRTARGIARTIERAVALQPFVVRVRARVRPERGGPVGPGRFAYRYLSPEMLEVVVELRDGPITVTARLEHRTDLRYPLMSVERVAVARPSRRRA
ncbi:MAG TPA: dihydroneopterin aldolase family protein [Thermoplasmata archaeon]|nr:dihydroneopterin aldolase family protein [Thermoplasmata archaeon]